jgi:aspartyl/asparaginyl-tRNA synthetase
MFSQHLRKSFKLFKDIYSNNQLLIKNQFVNFRTSSTNHDSSLKRTHFCGKLGIENVNEIVTVCGWLQTIRYSNFIILRDLHGIVQINLDEEFFKENKKFSIESLTNESVLAIQGLVTSRPFGRENKQMKTGHIEIKARQIEVLNEANNKLPFTISQFNRANEAVRFSLILLFSFLYKYNYVILNLDSFAISLFRFKI